MESIERAVHVTDEQFVEILKSRSEGTEDDGVVFEAWQNQLTEELKHAYETHGQEALSAEVISKFTDRAILYYRGGFKAEAISEMEELADVANSKAFDGSDLYARTSSVLERMKKDEEI